MNSLKDIDIAYINKKAAVKLVKFSEDFDSWEPERQIEYLKALASALNEAARVAYEERDKLLNELEVIAKLNDNAAKAVDISKQSLIQGLTEANQEKQEMARRILELEARVKAQDKVIEQLNEK